MNGLEYENGNAPEKSEAFFCGGGNPEKELFVLRNGTLRLIFQEHFVLRIIYEITNFVEL